MADDKRNEENERGAPRDDSDTDSGLGNLPPLSEFESSSGGDLDSDLPPLRDEDEDALGGLPPLSSIEQEDPTPTSGRMTPRPPEFESPSDFDTPTPPARGESSAFSDLTGEDDFTPDTPGISSGGGDSDLSTPMFDSAFGGGDESFTRTPDTSAPTQAMETPMFGSGGGSGGGFDDDAFGGGSRGGGTPAPDFSPDTGMGTTRRPPAAPVMAGSPGGGGGGAMGWIVGTIIGLVIGIGGFFGLTQAGIVGGSADRIQELQADNQRLQQQVDQIQRVGGAGATISPEEVNRLLEQQADLTTEIENLQTEIRAAEAELTAAENRLNTVQADVASAEEQFAQASRMYDDLQSQAAITRARQRGLQAEVEHLTSLLGSLEDANTRRAAMHRSVLAAAERLEAHIAESLPLMPSKYAKAKRLEEVQALKHRLEGATWVAPELMAEFIDIYQRELRLADSQDYFFAKIPVTDRYGSTTEVFAECVKNGTWSIFYRTLDGNHIGIYENLAGPNEPARFGFASNLGPAGRDMVVDVIVNNRPEGFEERVNMLAQKQFMLEEGTELQRAFESLL